MNLFVVGTDLAPGGARRLSERLAVVARRYPALDPATAWEVEGEGCFAASVHTPAGARAGACYVARTADEVVFHDGVAVSTTAAVDPGDAASLAASWDRSPEVLEGRYVLVRVRPHAPSVDVVVDPLGLEQVYEARDADGGTVLSNSADLLAGLAGPAAVDLTGASLMASIGWVAGDRTLCEGVSVVPPGTHRGWTPTRTSTRTDDLVVDLLGPPAAPPDDADVRRLADQLVAMVGALPVDGAPLETPLTAGRDSRVLAALVRAAGVPATYFTFGRRGDVDADVATELATRFGLELDLRSSDAARVVDRWDEASRRLVEQADGMVSLRHVETALDRGEGAGRSQVALWGAGGEIARCFYVTPELLAHPGSVGLARRTLARRLVRRHGGLVTPAAAEQAAGFVEGAVDDALERGLGPIDALERFYAEDRVRRWAYTNDRATAPVRATFSPFCTRPFVELAYRLPPRRRHAEWLHRRLMEVLAPELLAVRYERPWRAERRGAARAADAGRALVRRSARRAAGRLLGRGSGGAAGSWRVDERAAWFEQVLPRVRERCLAQVASPLWEVVDRGAFERLTAPTTPPEERRAHIDGMLDVVTLFHHRQAPG